MKGHVDESRGMDTLIAEALAKISDDVFSFFPFY
jgi:hypothetical protein